MKTYLYALLFASLAATNAQAGPVDLATAKKMAQKYIASPVSVDNAPAASMGKPQPRNRRCTFSITTKAKAL